MPRTWPWRSCFSSRTRFLIPPGPLPQPAGNIIRKPMAQLTRQHDDLAPVVTLVCDEIGQDVRDVEREVAPDVCLRWRHMASGGKAQVEKFFNPAAAPVESGKQRSARDVAPVDRCRHRDAVFPPEMFEPHAPRVVQVAGDHADRAPWRAGNGRIPDCIGNVFYQVRSDAAVGSPRSEDQRVQFRGHQSP